MWNFSYAYFTRWKNNAWAVWGPLKLGACMGQGPSGPLDKTALYVYFDGTVPRFTQEFANSSSCDVNVLLGLYVFRTRVQFRLVHVMWCVRGEGLTTKLAF